MLRLEVFEIKKRAVAWWRRFHLPFFTPWAWKWILFGAFMAGGAIGVFGASCLLELRGLM